MSINKRYCFFETYSSSKIHTEAISGKISGSVLSTVINTKKKKKRTNYELWGLFHQMNNNRSTVHKNENNSFS